MVQNRGVWRLITLNHPILLQHLVDFFPLVFPFVKKTILDGRYLTVWFSGFFDWFDWFLFQFLFPLFQLLNVNRQFQSSFVLLQVHYREGSCRKV